MEDTATVLILQDTHIENSARAVKKLLAHENALMTKVECLEVNERVKKIIFSNIKKDCVSNLRAVLEMEWMLRYGLDAESIPGYDCSSTDPTVGIKNQFYGITAIIYGLFIEILYVLDMAAMCGKEYSSLACYKIMKISCLYDIFAILLNSVLTGYFWIVGANYCSHPTFMFVSGAVAVGLWGGACMSCFILVINRFMDIWNRKLMRIVYGGARVYAVLLIPLIYCLYYTFFTPPLLFNSNHSAWFFYTFATKYHENNYNNYPHMANNLFVVVLTCILYILYSRSLLHISKIGHGLSWAQKSFFIQSVSLCASNLFAALIYFLVQFFPNAPYLPLIGHISWQLGHGIPAIVYATLNRTINREILALLHIRRPATARAVISSTKQSESGTGRIEASRTCLFKH